MDNPLSSDKLVSPKQPLLIPPSRFQSAQQPDSMNSSLQQTLVSSNQVLENKNVGSSKTLSDSNRCDASSRKILLSSLPEKEHLKPYGNSSSNASTQFSNLTCTRLLNNAGTSESNGNSLSDLHVNQSSISSNLPKLDSDDFVLKRWHFEEILEFCSKVYIPCKCNVCGKTYETFDELLKNCENHNIHMCNFCDKGFRNKNYLLKHISWKHPKERNTRCFKIPAVIPNQPKVGGACDVCGKVLQTHQSLIRHRKTHVPIAFFACHLCDKAYRQKSTLNDHIRIVHKKEIKHFCEVCGKGFIRQANVRIHMAIHTGEKNFKCDICDRKFGSSQQLRNHRFSHAQERSFMCHLCAKTFKCNSHLIIHMKTHSDERPYKCSECGSGFINKSKLKRHEYIHSENKPHNCLTCGKGFTQRALLVRHFKIHPEPSWTKLMSLDQTF